MDEFINTCVAALNDVGQTFGHYATAMFIQVSVLVAVLFVIDLLLRRRLRATVRYWIWMLVFLKLLLPPSLSVPTGIGYWCGGHVAPPPVASPAATRVGGPQLVRAGAAARTIVAPPASSAPGIDRVTRSSAAPATIRFEPLTRQGIIFLLWSIGVLAFAGWMLQRLLFVRRLIARGTPAPADVLDMLDQCRRRMQIRWNVGLRCSAGLFSPAVCGLLRPTILVPATLLEKLPADQLKTVLIHELAHVKRADLWLNCLQAVLQIVYFYHPLVWLANALTRRVREQAVDEMVLVALGAEAKSYSHTLIEIAEMAFLRAGAALGLVGVAESKKALEGRIRHMMTRPVPVSARVGAWGLMTVLVSAAVLLPMAHGQAQGAATAVTPPPNSQRTVAVADGVTVELVGLCQDPTAKGQQWWRPDGTPMEPPEYELRSQEPWKYPAFGYLLKFSVSEDVTYRSQVSFDQLFFSSGPVTSRGQAVVFWGENHDIGKALGDQTDIQVDMAAGDWRAHELAGGKIHQDAFVTPDGGVIVLSGLRPNPSENRASQSLVEVTTTSDKLDIRLECATTNGRRLRSWDEGTLTSKGHLVQCTFGFAASIDEISRITVKHRPFHRVVFRNVSLRPGQRTGVQVSPNGGASPGSLTTYEVNRRVADFPPAEDFSTPEAAYATINRMAWDDPSVWQKVSVTTLARRLAQGSNERGTRRDPAWAEVLRNARIREVIVWNLTRAAVIAELPQGSSGKDIVDPIDVRYLRLENGRWLNTGNGRFASVAIAKTQFLERFERDNALREEMKDPLRYADEIREAAAQLFERLRTADYADILSHYRDGVFDPDGWKKFPTQGYTVHTDYSSFALWCCTRFKDNPIIDVQLGEVFIGDTLVADKTGWPTVPYKLTLKDGTTLAGELPFQYSSDQGQGHWQGLEGIDWHLWSRQ
jgi:beta-lactamase regulating signal transducer with metallopeptidase domain